MILGYISITYFIHGNYPYYFHTIWKITTSKRFLADKSKWERNVGKNLLNKCHTKICIICRCFTLKCETISIFVIFFTNIELIVGSTEKYVY